jgi:hypothetical protein
MGMRIHKTRQYDTAGGVEPGFVRIESQQIGAMSSGNDLIVLQENSSILNQAERTESLPSLRAAGNDQELGCRVDEHGDI